MKQLTQDHPKKPATESESENKSLKIQSWFLGHAVLQEAVWLPVASTKAPCQAENHPQANLANMQTSAPTKDLVKPAVGLPAPCSRWRYTDLHACLFWVNVEKLDISDQNIILKVTNSERGFLHPLRLQGSRKAGQSHNSLKPCNTYYVQTYSCHSQTGQNTALALQEGQKKTQDQRS